MQELIGKYIPNFRRSCMLCMFDQCPTTNDKCVNNYLQIKIFFTKIPSRGKRTTGRSAVISVNFNKLLNSFPLQSYQYTYRLEILRSSNKLKPIVKRRRIDFAFNRKTFE